MLVDRVLTCLEGVKLLGGHYPHRPSTTLEMMLNTDIELNIHVLFRGMLQRTSIIIYHYILCPLYISSWQSYLQLHTPTHTHTHTHTQGITTQLPGVHIVPQKILQEQISSPNIIYFMFWSLYTRLTAIICTLLGSSKFLQRVGDQIQNHECS